MAGLDHRPETLDVEALTDTRIRLRVRAPRGLVTAMSAWSNDRYATWGEEHETPLALAFDDGVYDYFEGEVAVPDRRLRYLIEARGPGRRVWLGEEGFYGGERPPLGHFHLPYLQSDTVLELPDWVRRAVFYQVLVDRFARERPAADPIDAWRHEPYRAFGGNLDGIRQRLGYLEDLGISALILTPVVSARTYHRYDATDFKHVDPLLGGDAAMRRLVRDAHRRGIAVVLDAALNHSGDAFPPFELAREDRLSPYRSWYRFDSSPTGYETFGRQIPSLPKLMTHQRPVQDYLLDCVTHWFRRFGIDGLRLDVANEVAPSLLRRLRDRVKAIRPDALLLGEIWHGPDPWLRGDMLDAVTGYFWREATINYVAQGRIDARGFHDALMRDRAMGRWNHRLALVGSHDTPRFRTLCAGSVARVRQALLLLFVTPLTPCIYYGDELGMQGGDDPHSRMPVNWDTMDEGTGLVEWTRSLARLRRSRPWLADPGGEFVTPPGSPRLLAIVRDGPGERVAAVVNPSPTPATVALPAGPWTVVLGAGVIGPTGRIEVAPEAALLATAPLPLPGTDGP